MKLQKGVYLVTLTTETALLKLILISKEKGEMMGKASRVWYLVVVSCWEVQFFKRVQLSGT